jgi:hypothetical protein
MVGYLLAGVQTNKGALIMKKLLIVLIVLLFSGIANAYDCRKPVDRAGWRAERRYARDIARYERRPARYWNNGNFRRYRSEEFRRHYRSYRTGGVIVIIER